MRLQDLQIVPGPHPELGKKKLNLLFRSTVGHVSELVLRELPKDFSLDDDKKVGKAVVVMGGTGKTTIALTVAHINWPTISVEQFLHLKLSAQQEAVLHAIHDSLLTLATDSAHVEQIALACTRVRDSGFQKTVELSLSKWHSRRQWRAVVEYVIQQGGNQVHLLIRSKDGIEAQRVHIITTTNPWKLRHLLGSGGWDASTYTLRDRKGDLVASVSLQDYCG